jgi:hypothetical protein
MKSILFFLLLCFSFPLHAQTGQPTWRLTGLINLPDEKKAILESTSTSLREKEAAILAEGEAANPFGSRIELLKIDYKKQTAKVYINHRQTNLDLNTQAQAKQPEAEPTILFERASFEGVLKLYSSLLGRTLLRHPLLHETDFTFSARAQNQNDVIRRIEIALNDQGITVIPDADIFALLVPKEIVSKIKVESSKAKAPIPRALIISNIIFQTYLSYRQPLFMPIFSGADLRWTNNYRMGRPPSTCERRQN